LKGVEITELDGRICCLKKYPHAETARYKVYGSGYLNESLLPGALSAAVPRIICHGRTAHDDYAYMEFIDGRHRPAENLSQPEVHACGSMLGKIHQQRGRWFGSLNGEYRYTSWRDSWRPRWEVMIRLLRDADDALADKVNCWGKARLASLRETCDPCLVHGDYGPGNLIWVERRPLPVVIDWEHARFGHPAEDWAKIFLAEIFREANGFSWAIGSCTSGLWQGWLDACEGNYLSEILTEEALLFFLVYFAGTLGVFLDGARGGRIHWIRDVLDGEVELMRSMLPARARQLLSQGGAMSQGTREGGTGNLTASGT
jgi:hypothetical protein